MANPIKEPATDAVAAPVAESESLTVYALQSGMHIEGPKGVLQFAPIIKQRRRNGAWHSLVRGGKLTTIDPEEIKFLNKLVPGDPFLSFEEQPQDED